MLCGVQQRLITWGWRVFGLVDMILCSRDNPQGRFPWLVYISWGTRFHRNHRSKVTLLKPVVVRGCTTSDTLDAWRSFEGRLPETRESYPFLAQRRFLRWWARRSALRWTLLGEGLQEGSRMVVVGPCRVALHGQDQIRVEVKQKMSRMDGKEYG